MPVAASSVLVMPISASHSANYPRQITKLIRNPTTTKEGKGKPTNKKQRKSPVKRYICRSLASVCQPGKQESEKNS